MDSLCVSRSYESQAWLVYANKAGTIRLKNFSDLSAGRTQLVEPMAKPRIARGRTEQVVRFGFNRPRLKAAEDTTAVDRRVSIQRFIQRFK